MKIGLFTSDYGDSGDVIFWTVEAGIASMHGSMGMGMGMWKLGLGVAI